MIIDVILLEKFQENKKTWTYSVKAEDFANISFSTIVEIDFNHKKCYGFVVNKHEINQENAKLINRIIFKTSLNSYQQKLCKYIGMNSFVDLSKIINLFINRKKIDDILQFQQELIEKSIDKILARKKSFSIKDINQKCMQIDLQKHYQILEKIDFNEFLKNQENLQKQITVIVTPNDITTDVIYQQLTSLDANVAKYKNNKYESLINKLLQEDKINIVIGNYKVLFLMFKQINNIIFIHPEAINYIAKNDLFINIKVLQNFYNQINQIEVRNISYLNEDNQFLPINIKPSFKYFTVEDISSLLSEIETELIEGNVILYIPPALELQLSICKSCNVIGEMHYCPKCGNKMEQMVDEIYETFQLAIKEKNLKFIHNQIPLNNQNNTLIILDEIPYVNIDNIKNIYVLNLFDNIAHAQMEKIYFYYDAILNLASNNQQNITFLEVEKHEHLEEIFSSDSNKAHKLFGDKLIAKNIYKANIATIYITEKYASQVKYTTNKIIDYLNKNNIKIIYHDHAPYQKYRIWRMEMRIVIEFSTKNQLQAIYNLFKTPIKIEYY